MAPGREQLDFLAQGAHISDDGISLSQPDFGLQLNSLLFCHNATLLTTTQVRKHINVVYIVSRSQYPPAAMK